MTEADFLRAILENPEDDAPRMALADWLQERDDPRGEFLAVQLALAANRGESLRQREWELWEEHRRVWFGPLFPSMPISGPPDECLMRWHDSYPFEDHRFCTATVRRGFIEHVEMALADFEYNAEYLFRFAPLTSVRLTDRGTYHNGLGHCWFFQGRAHPSFGVPAAANLPDPLWSILAAEVFQEPNRWKAYQTRSDARDALSAACVTYGRDLAGLPPHPAPAPDPP